jgi:hypothetical protein
MRTDRGLVVLDATGEFSLARVHARGLAAAQVTGGVNLARSPSRSAGVPLERWRSKATGHDTQGGGSQAVSARETRQQ